MNKKIASLIFVSLLSTSVFSEDTAQKKHSVVMKNFRGDTYYMSLDTKYIGVNGDTEPGLYFSTVKSKYDLGFKTQEKWEKKPSNKEAFEMGRHEVDEAKKSIGMRIVFEPTKAKEAARIVADLFKNSPEKIQFSFDATKADNSFVPYTTDIAKLDPQGSTNQGLISYRTLEYKIPEADVTIKIGKDGKTMKLSDYIDSKINRSAYDSAKEAITKFFSKKKPNEEDQAKNTERNLPKGSAGDLPPPDQKSGPAKNASQK